MNDADPKSEGEPEDTVQAAPGQIEKELGEKTVRKELEPTLMSGLDPTIGHADAPTRGATETTFVLGADQPTVALQPGAHVGSYRLVRQIGKGAQGSVWHAFNEVAERDFALKFINSELLRAKWATASIRSEANVLFDLTHSAIVRLNNIEQVGQHLFLVMELLEGPSLSGFLKDRRAERGVDPPALDVDECLWLLERLAPALDYAAAEGVTHRDIKPGNLMFTAPVDQSTHLTECDADVKLCDFGIAFVGEKTEPGAKVSPTGTPPYMAPEVIEGEVPTWRADVYSLGATLQALYLGEPPLRGSTLVEILDKIKQRSIPPLDTGNKAFDAAIARALSPDPSARQGSFDDLLFEASGGKLGLRAASRSRSYRLLAAASTVLALGAVAFALDPFGLRRGQAEFLLDDALGQRDGGTVVITREFPLRFDFRSPGDETVAVSVDDAPSVKVLPVVSGEDRYELNVDLEGAGLHDVTVMTEDGSSILGQTTFFLDLEVELPDDPVRLVGEPPFDRSRPIPMVFQVLEDDVTVRDVSRAPARLLDVEFSEGRARYELEIEPEENRDLWQVTRTFQFRDRYDNAAERSITIEVYDRANIVERLTSSFPGGVDGLHLWDLKERVMAIEAWRTNVLAAPIPTDTARGLVAARREDIDAVLSLSADPPERELALALEAGTWLLETAPDGSQTLTTQAADVTLRGTTTSTRSSTIEAEVDVEDGLGIVSEPVIDRGTGAFGLTVSLESGADGLLRLSLPGGGPVRTLRLVRDDTAPETRLAAPPAREVINGRRVDLVLDITDDRSGLDSVILIAPDGTETVLECDERDGLWRRTAALDLEGENLFRVRATDRVGNPHQEDFTVLRDTTRPTLSVEILPPQSVRTGESAVMRWQFDEPIASATAHVEFVDRDGHTVKGPEVMPTSEGTWVQLEVPVPFRPLERIHVELSVWDGVGNERPLSAAPPVTHDPWGAVPDPIRDSADYILDPVELERLVGRKLGAEPYVADVTGWFPRCIRDRRTRVEFVYVHSGSFAYGPPDHDSSVSMGGFYLARTEVSGRQFVLGARSGEMDLKPYDNQAPENSDLPILTNRTDAGLWCSRLAFQLPTEAQWEYAASGELNLLYPWGNEPDVRRRNGPSGQKTAAPPPFVRVDDDNFAGGRSWCGALHMSGNVAEICSDDLDPMSDFDPAKPVGATTSNQTGYRIRGGSRQTATGETEMTHGRRAGPNGNLRKNGLRPVWPLSEHD